MSINKRVGKKTTWYATICANDHIYHIGTFETKELAQAANDVMYQEWFGDTTAKKHNNMVKIKHNMSKSREYCVWHGMKQRCYNKKADAYKNYGGRGITVCDRWLKSFENFVEDMGKCPENLTLDRRNVDKEYCKNNCRWASKTVQSRNRRIKNKYEVSGIRSSGKKFEVSIGYNNKQKHLGMFSTLDEAIAVRVAAEKKYWGNER